MRRSLTRAAIVIAFVAGLAVPARGEDPRTAIRLPADVREAFLAEMRRHMDSLDDVLVRLAAADFKGAAATAREELVPGSGKGFGRFLPIDFRELGLGMHRAAADFAVVADKAAAPPTAAEWQATIAALQAVSAQCRACHGAFRVE
jgi:cytochrome c556